MKNIVLTIVGLSAVTVAVGLYAGWIRVPFAIERMVNNDTVSDTRTLQGIYATNYADGRKLVGATHNIFVGKVIKQSGTKQRYNIPETQFDVDVLLNIKGKVNGAVVINQLGVGYKNGMFYSWENGDIINNSDKSRTIPSKALLKPGATYLFATRYNKDLGWYTLANPPYDSMLITTDTALSNDSLKTLAARNERVRALETAYPNEILLDADIANDATWNSYKSRHFDSNGGLIDDTIVIAQQREARIMASPLSEGVISPNILPAESPKETVSPTASPEITSGPSVTPEASTIPATPEGAPITQS